MAAERISVGGIEYYTLLEHPVGGGGGSAGSRGCVLLIHAIMSNLHMWDGTAAALRGAGWSTLRIEHVGHHRSGVPSSRGDTGSASYSLDDVASHFRTIAQLRLGPSGAPAAVVGCSAGGVAALRYGMLFGGEGDGKGEAGPRLVSICSPGARSPPGFAEVWEARIAALEQDGKSGGDVAVAQTLARWFPGDRPQERDARDGERPNLQTCTLEGYTLLARAVGDYDHSADLGRLDGSRCLVVAGGRDASSSPDALRKLAAEIPGARFELLEDGGHLPSVNDAEAFNEVLLRFLG